MKVFAFKVNFDKISERKTVFVVFLFCFCLCVDFIVLNFFFPVLLIIMSYCPLLHIVFSIIPKTKK